MTAPPPAEAGAPGQSENSGLSDDPGLFDEGDALVEALVEDDGWGPVEPLVAIASRAAESALRAAGADPARASVSMLFAGDDAVARLNAAHRGRAAPTNVLSWPAFPLRPPSPGVRPPPPPLARQGRTPLGDLALAFCVVRSEAHARDLAIEAHVAHLVAHGVLHLLGYDHQTDADADVMEGLEREALAELGIADPYA